MIRRVLLAALLASLPWFAAAQPLNVEDLVRPPAYANPLLSASGKYFAVTLPVKGRMNIAVVDLDRMQADTITAFSDFDVVDMAWVGDERLVFSLGQFNSPTGPGAYDGGGLFVVGRDGKNFRRLSPTVREMRNSGQVVLRQMRLVRALPDNTREVIVAGNLRDVESIDLYRLNLDNGRTSLITDRRPTNTQAWVLDRKHVARVTAAIIKDTTSAAVYYRSGEEAPWQELTRFDVTRGPTFVPLAFEADNRTLLVATNAGRDTMAIYRYDPETRKLGELVAQHPRFDMGADASGSPVPGLLRDWKSGEIVGFTVQADKPQVVWTDEAYARTQRTIDAALPDTVNTFTRTPDGKRVVITALSDRQPPRWLLLDEDKRQLIDLFSSRPWLKREQLVEQRSAIYKTRDGLEIPTYYFLPRGYKPRDKLPTVVHIHGGPAARPDSWGEGFGWMEGQLLASRGYAVVVPNFRITPGLGGRIYYGGFGTLGRAMLDDHEDAARWAVAQGFADADRICLSGASYGGYAALMVLARHPSTFKCGVAGLPVTDWKMMVTSPLGDTAYSESAVNYVLRMAGVTRVADLPDEISPLNLAARIKRPVMMYAGADDIRVPLEQVRAMEGALRRAGNPPEAVIVKAEEGHGFGKVDNNVDLYNQIFAFLERHLGQPRKP